VQVLEGDGGGNETVKRRGNAHHFMELQAISRIDTPGSSCTAAPMPEARRSRTGSNRVEDSAMLELAEPVGDAIHILLREIATSERHGNRVTERTLLPRDHGEQQARVGVCAIDV
jgi:hypothetical protein